jgi:hypothetical protein
MVEKKRSAAELNVRAVEMAEAVTPAGCSVIPRMTRSQKLILVSLSLLKFVALASFSVIAPFYPSEVSVYIVTQFAQV